MQKYELVKLILQIKLRYRFAKMLVGQVKMTVATRLALFTFILRSFDAQFEFSIFICVLIFLIAIN